MKSIVIAEPGNVEVKDIPIPERKTGEVLLKMLYGGVCGSDLNSFRGTNAYVSYPRTIGHEIAAEIVEVDESNSFGLKKGMLVTCNPYFNCTQCYSCRRGHVNCCTTNQTMGVQREGAFSEYIVMPKERVYDGSGIDPETLSLIEPFCISNHGVGRAGIKQGDKVLVIGSGTIGILAAVSASLKGGQVTVCDVSADKLEYAKEMGITQNILYTSKDGFLKDVENVTDGNGFDVAIEAAGNPQAFINCVDAAAFQARIAVIGVSKNHADFNYTEIQRKELNIFGSRAALKKDFEETIQYVKDGKVDLQKIISRRYNIGEAVEAFKDLNSNSDSILKMVFKF